MTQIIVQNADFDGSYVQINGVTYAIPLGRPFEASAAIMEVLDNAGVPYLKEPFDLGQPGQIRISRRYRGPRFVVVNGSRYDFPVGKWFTPPAGALDIIISATAGMYVMGGGASSIPALAMTFSDGTPLQFSDGTYLEFAA
jgi:hypothetical protein